MPSIESHSPTDWSNRSSHVAPMVSSLIKTYKANKSGDLSVLQRLIHKMLHSKEMSIADHYASVFMYLHLFSNYTSYEDFLKIIEEDSFDEDTKARELSLLYGALINSGCVLKWSEEVQMAVVRRLLSIATSLGDHIGIVFEFFRTYLSNVKEIKFRVSELIPKKIDDNVSPRYLHMLCMVEEKSSIKCKKLEKLLAKNVGSVAQILINGSDYHLYSELCSSIIKQLYEDKDNLVELWETMLLGINSKPHRKVLSLVIFLSEVLIITTEEDANILIPRFFSLGSSRLFSRNVKDCPKAVITSFDVGFKHLNSEVKLVLIKSIISENEKLNEKSLGTRIIDKLKINLDFASIQDLCKFYKKIISGSLQRTLLIGDDIKEVEFTATDKCLYIASYGKLLGHPNCMNEVVWRTKCLKYLFLFGFTSQEVTFPEVTDTARKVFFASINYRFPRLADYINTLDRIVMIAGKNMSNKKLTIGISSQMQSAWKMSQKCLGQLASGVIDEDLAIIVQVLLLYMMLLLFKDQKTACDSILEIVNILKHTDDKSLHWTEVLVDLFLQLLSMYEQSHRHIIGCVFSHLSGHLTPKALNQILMVLEDKEEDHDSEDSDSSEHSDKEHLKESSSESEESELEDMVETPNDKLRTALLGELYQMDTASTAGSINLDDLDEEESKNLNSTLGKIFKEHCKMPLSKEEKTMKIHFKVRALVLLEILLDHYPPVEYLLKIVPKLMSVLKVTLADKECHDVSFSIKKVLNKCCSLKKFNVREETSIASDDLERCLLDCMKSDCSTSIFQEISDQIRGVAILLVRIANTISIDPSPLTNILQGAIDSYFTQSDSMYPSHFVISLLSSDSLIVVHFIPTMVYYAFSPTVKNMKNLVAMECLHIFYKDSRFIKKNDKIDWDSVDVATVKLVKKIKKRLKQIAEKEFELNQSYGIALFDLISLLNKRSEKLGLDPKEIPSIVKQFLSQFPPFVGKLKKAFTNCVAVLKLTKYVQKNSESEPSSKKRTSSESEKSPSHNGSVKKTKVSSDED